MSLLRLSLSITTHNDLRNKHLNCKQLINEFLCDAHDWFCILNAHRLTVYSYQFWTVMLVSGNQSLHRTQFTLTQQIIQTMETMTRISFVQHLQQPFQRLPSNRDRTQVTPKKTQSFKKTFDCMLFLSIGSLRSPRQRRQRTTSINLTKTIDATESIIRANNRTIYTAGRPPWYDCQGQQVEPFVIGLFGQNHALIIWSFPHLFFVFPLIFFHLFFPLLFFIINNNLNDAVAGICGGSASGKTTVAQKIIESLDVPWVTLLSMDCFYKVTNVAITFFRFYERKWKEILLEQKKKHKQLTSIVWVSVFGHWKASSRWTQRIQFRSSGCVRHWSHGWCAAKTERR